MRTFWHATENITYCISISKKFGTTFENQDISSFTEIFKQNINKQLNLNYYEKVSSSLRKHVHLRNRSSEFKRSSNFSN